MIGKPIAYDVNPAPLPAKQKSINIIIAGHLYDFSAGGAAFCPCTVWETPLVLVDTPPTPKDPPISTPAEWLLMLIFCVPFSKK